jgi:hypothetical protein
VELAKKSGFRGQFDRAAMERSRVERYQSDKAVATWGQYLEYARAH